MAIFELRQTTIPERPRAWKVTASSTAVMAVLLLFAGSFCVYAVGPLGVLRDIGFVLLAGAVFIGFVSAWYVWRKVPVWSTPRTVTISDSAIMFVDLDGKQVTIKKADVLAFRLLTEHDRTSQSSLWPWAAGATVSCAECTVRASFLYQTYTIPFPEEARSAIMSFARDLPEKVSSLALYERVLLVLFFAGMLDNVLFAVMGYGFWEGTSLNSFMSSISYGFQWDFFIGKVLAGLALLALALVALIRNNVSFWYGTFRGFRYVRFFGALLFVAACFELGYAYEVYRLIGIG